MAVPTNRSSLLALLLHGPPGPRDSRPVRIADFYIREFNADAGTDALTCRECKQTVTFDHDEVPPVSSLVDCPSCGLPSRVPTLPSQAGVTNPADPPPHSERS